MTTAELLTAVEQAGGVLTLKDDTIGYDLPESATHLLPELQQHRDAIMVSLRNRLTANVERWVSHECVAVWCVSSNPQIMFREFVRWSTMPCSESTFLKELRRKGFVLDESGMIAGLALAEDFRAAMHYEHARLV